MYNENKLFSFNFLSNPGQPFYFLNLLVEWIIFNIYFLHLSFFSKYNILTLQLHPVGISSHILKKTGTKLLVIRF